MSSLAVIPPVRPCVVAAQTCTAGVMVAAISTNRSYFGIRSRTPDVDLHPSCGDR